ncbi:MAG: GDP-L-fucose synthase [Actinobacteria bacterium]|nr:GDP-L-fucose synthase [Actinomycetota bacterium]
MPSQDAPIYVAGHHGLVGSAVWRALAAAGFTNLVGFRSSEVDLTDRDAAADALATVRPAVVVDAAARVGGILANSTQPVDFLEDNLRIQTNLFAAAHNADVPRLLFLGSSCIYPKFADQPIRESSLLTGPLEPTNQAYAIAKIAGIIGVQAYREQYGRAWISAMPTNLYGPGDNFDLRTSHVLPAMIRKFHEAKLSGDPVTLWGTGTPRREFLHTDDVASAVVHLLGHYDDPETINIGTGTDVTIAELAATIADVVGYEGEVRWDTGKPDGTPRKLLDVSRLLALGWRPQVSLRDGIASTYRWYLEQGDGRTGET